MKTLYRYIKPYSLRVMAGMIIKLVGTVSELLIPWILEYIIDDVLLRGQLGPIIIWGAMMVVASAACVTLNIIANRKAAAVARDVTRSVRHDLYARIAHLSGAQIDAVTVPSLVSRLTSDTYNVHQMIGMVQRMGIRAPILLIGGIIVTLFQDVPLSLILIATMPFIGVSVTMVSVKGIPLFKRLQEATDGLVRIVRENVGGARVIKALSKSDYENGRFKAQSEKVASENVLANVVMSLSSPFVTLFLNIGLVAVLIAGAYRVGWGLTKPGEIMAFLSYFTIISNGMLGITRIFVVMSRASASAKRIEEVLVMEEDLPVIPCEKQESEYFIEFKNVTFSYNKRKPTLENISFRLKKGETLGLLGPTGSGKSTILMLLMRLYDVDEGEILIDGKNIKSIPPEMLHTMFGVTFQTDVVYSDTAKANITLGRDITADQLARAVSDAQAEYIYELKDGPETHLNAQGTNLSGGQKQRLIIARALAGDPEILLLDDASSALDYRTDASLRAALRENHAHTTSIIIASRVSSVHTASEIIMLEEGRCVAHGTHDELFSANEEYRRIAVSQMGGAR